MYEPPKRVLVQSAIITARARDSETETPDSWILDQTKGQNERDDTIPAGNIPFISRSVRRPVSQAVNRRFEVVVSTWLPPNGARRATAGKEVFNHDQTAFRKKFKRMAECRMTERHA